MNRTGPAAHGPLRIGHLITYFGDGGAERILLQTLRRLDPDRFRSSVLSLRAAGPLSDTFMSSGAPVEHLSMGVIPGPVTMMRLVSWLRRSRIDVVHAYLYHASILARLAGRAAGVPVIITSTRCSLEYLPAPALWMDRWTAPLGDRIVAVSQGTASFVIEQERIASHRVTVISNGVDLEWFAPGDRSAARSKHGLPPDAYVLAVIGRLHEQKGHTWLFRALEQYVTRARNVVCLVAGDGPLRNDLESEAQARGLESVCRFVGRLTDMRSVYDAADVVVLPSLYEGMPNVILEGMAMGCPVVATRVAGSEELVETGVTGVLVPARDPVTLCDALSWVRNEWHNDESVRARIRATAQSKHDVNRMVQEVERLYEREWELKNRRNDG